MAVAKRNQSLIEEDRTTIEERHEKARQETLSDPTGKLYIGGEWVEGSSGDTIEVTDPTTQNVLGTVPAGNSEDIDRAVDAAWDCYRDRWEGVAPPERHELLYKLAQITEENHEDLARLVTLENGKTINDARWEIDKTAEYLRFYGGVSHHIIGETFQNDGSVHVQTIREPYGVVGQIIPWNAPVLMAAWKLAPALAAGNAAVLKPAEEACLSVLEWVGLLEDELPDGLVNVVTGYGPDAGGPLANHEDVYKVAFTGSREIGSVVMENASENITDVTLELGGKSPIVVFPDADIERAIETTIVSVFPNTGENCSAASRMFLHEDIKEDFLDPFLDALSQMTLGDPLLDETELGPKVSEDQLDRMMTYIEHARDTGAEFLIGGDRPSNGGLEKGSYFFPTVMSGIDNDNKCAREEIFGPVQIMFEWSDYDEMMEIANDTDYGLAAGVVTQDLDNANRAARDLEAGNVWVNTYNAMPAGTPFGGYKQSGIGRETAYDTLKHYTQLKTIGIDNPDVNPEA